MRLELVGALLVIAVVATCASAENSGKQNDIDYERSVREALDEDDVQNVLGDYGRSVRNVVHHFSTSCNYRCCVLPHLVAEGLDTFVKLLQLVRTC